MNISALEIARLLLQKEDIEEEARWQALEEALLDKEVEVYRKGIRALSAELATQGLPTTLNEESAQLEQQGRPQGVEVQL